MKKKNIFAIVTCFVSAFILLMICSRSSFLYPCNDWNDANSYFTMGKGMMNGQVIYRDLYDQKGPYLYFFYGLAYLFSHDTFAGVFLLEIAAVGTFLYFGYRTLCLYMKETVALVCVPVLATVMLASKSFYWGGAAEEFMLPLFGYSLYASLRYFKEDDSEKPAFRMLLINGILAGVVMLVKYTMLGFYFAWMAMMVFAFLLKKDIKGCLKGCFVFLSGMGIAALPWLVYLGVNGALAAFYECYIYNNIFLYSNLTDADNGIAQRIYDLVKLLYWLILDNPWYFALIILGIGTLLLSRKSKWIERINILMLFGFLFLGIFVGGSVLPYYSIPLMTFTVLGMIPVGMLVQKVVAMFASKLAIGKTELETAKKMDSEIAKKKVPETAKQVIFAGTLVLSLVTGSLFAYHTSMNSYFMEQPKEEYFLYKFKAVIDEEENPTLLNVGCLDAGLYTVAEVVPTCRFFQTNGIGFETMFTEQERYIEKGLTDFVLVRNDWVPENIERKYEKVAEEPYEWGGNEFVYTLYKRKNG